MAGVCLGLLGLLIVADVVARLVAIRWALPIFERPLPPRDASPAADPPGIPLRIPTTHGLQLGASLSWPAERAPLGMLVFCPPFAACRTAAADYVNALREAGFAVLAFDFRNQGDSAPHPAYRPLHWFTEHEVADTFAVIDYVQSRPEWRHLPLGLMGISRGANAALIAAARAHSGVVRCVIADSPFSTSRLVLHYCRKWAQLFLPVGLWRCIPRWHVSGTMRLMRWWSAWRRACWYVEIDPELRRLADTPVLLIAAERDAYIPPHLSAELFGKLGHGSHEFWVVPEANHGGCRAAQPEAYDARVTAFCRAHLSPAGWIPPAADEKLARLLRTDVDWDPPRIPARPRRAQSCVEPALRSADQRNPFSDRGLQS